MFKEISESGFDKYLQELWGSQNLEPSHLVRKDIFEVIIQMAYKDSW